MQETMCHHIHVRSCIQRPCRSLLQVGHPMSLHLTNRIVVGHHKSREPPLIAEQIRQQPFVGCSRYSVDGIERAHHRTHSGFHRPFIRSQVHIIHQVTTHIHRIVVTSRFRSSIQRKVLHTGHDFIVLLHAVTLITAHIGSGHQRTEVWVLPTSFCNTSPAGIPTDVYHRTEGPADSISTGLRGRNTCHTCHRHRIPATRQGQRNREDCFVPVNHIGTHYQRNSQTSFLHRHTLHLVNLIHSLHIEKAADLTSPDSFCHLAVLHCSRHQVIPSRQIQLS